MYKFNMAFLIGITCISMPCHAVDSNPFANAQMIDAKNEFISSPKNTVKPVKSSSNHSYIVVRRDYHTPINMSFDARSSCEGLNMWNSDHNGDYQQNLSLRSLFANVPNQDTITSRSCRQHPDERIGETLVNNYVFHDAMPTKMDTKMKCTGTDFFPSVHCNDFYYAR